jgi:hypothetical protein
MKERRSDQELIGRAGLDDIEAILAITNTDDGAEFHDVGATIDTRFTWDYERARPRLGKLYEKAKLTQWNANDLPWETDVDQEEVVRANAAMSAASGLAPMMDLSPPGATRSGSSSASSPRTGRCRSSSTASRAPSSARPGSWRPCPGSTPSTTPPPR